VWCQDNNLPLKVSDTKELIADYRKRGAKHVPIQINMAVMEWVESFKILGVHMTNDLSWFEHTNTGGWALRSSQSSTATSLRAS
jgi:hypothetical protein